MRLFVFSDHSGTILQLDQAQIKSIERRSGADLQVTFVEKDGSEVTSILCDMIVVESGVDWLVSVDWNDITDLNTLLLPRVPSTPAWKVFCADCRAEYHSTNAEKPVCCGVCGGDFFAVKKDAI